MEHKKAGAQEIESAKNMSTRRRGHEKAGTREGGDTRRLECKKAEDVGVQAGAQESESVRKLEAQESGSARKRERIETGMQKSGSASKPFKTDKEYHRNILPFEMLLFEIFVFDTLLLH